MNASRRRHAALLAAGVIALLVTACAPGNGADTRCSVWMSMSNSDQRSLVTGMYQQDGDSNPSSDDVSELQRQASTYCADPYPNTDTISGMYDSRAQ